LGNDPANHRPGSKANRNGTGSNDSRFATVLLRMRFTHRQGSRCSKDSIAKANNGAG
tara:strand:- start:14 stop:184 length:171 start_codon:yes stop_codon:yes gene_type:complete